MPLSWNEIKDRALRFSREWQDESSEDADERSRLQDGGVEVPPQHLSAPAAAAANVESLTRTPLRVPPALVKAHQILDRAVDAAYIAAEKAAARKPPKLTTDADRVAFLFERYQHLTSLLPAAKPKRARRRRTDSAV